MAVDIVIPQAGESVTSGVITRWLKNDGDYVKRDENVLELETDKVTLEVAAPAAGALKIKTAAGETVAIGAVVGSLDEAAAPAAEPKPQQAAPSEAGALKSAVASARQPAAEATAGDVRATPLALKLASERGVDLSKVTATGAGGRVREQDVMAFLDRSGSQPSAASAANGSPPPAASPAGAGPRGVTRERMTPLRQRIATRLVQAQHTAAMLTTFNECDMGPVIELRKQYKDEFEKKHGIGLGFMSFFVKAAVSALKAYPLVNSFIVNDEQGHPAIEKHEYCDVAVAVSTPRGLVVPVLRNCERLGMAQIEQGIKDMAVRARDGKLTLEEMQGGTFTITNGGVFGSLMSTPILNPPQSAILGMHATKNRAVEYPVGSGNVAIRPMMYLALSYDHRIIDGAEAVQFLVRIKQCIEDPQRLLLEI
ncbi:MAG: 2-oxoglutarate dehydrogenase complex dihydrolipoyllysine-residue succinyltransferase [Phycisphaeraceae bacterium]|nr:2-oxoglutarate dehydrogenase complex dihydrolipoyllysine-residue succinyltransferase [Phycisphaeraceae bacterium]MBX3408361.1 2-oxoglutarate dehydrogenase complex dihydrolipoyllysine-residue succinyltransferase [Phycisphaeraceae bacterium]